MSAARAVRLRVALHYERVLERDDQAWDAGEAESALRGLEERWPQIQTQFAWLCAQRTGDAELQGTAARYPLAGRHILRAYLPADERQHWFELLREVSAASGERAHQAIALCELAICRHELAQPEAALEFARAAWQLGQVLEEPRLQADVLWALGVAEHVSGQDRAAVESFSRALVLRRELLGAEHPEVAEALSGLGYAWSDLGEYERVIELLAPVAPLGGAAPTARGGEALTARGGEALTARGGEALTARGGEAPREHAKLAASYRLLGTAYGYRGDLARAEQCCLRALELDRRILAPGHRDVALDLNELAGVRRARGDLDGAIACMHEALLIDEKCHGENHPATGIHLSNLGVFLRESGQVDAALRALRRCLAIFRTIYGERHPALATVLGHLGRCWLDLGDAPAAVEALQQAIQLRRALQGDHPKLISDGESLAAALALLAASVAPPPRSTAATELEVG